MQIGAIGSETAKKLASVGLRSCLVPERFQAEGILDAIKPEAMRGKRVLIPRAAEAREVLPETLRAWGASVDVVIAYRAVVPATPLAPLADLLDHDRVDVITFTSSSTVRILLNCSATGDSMKSSVKSAIACIGPITAQTVADWRRKWISGARIYHRRSAAALVEHFNRREISDKRGYLGAANEFPIYRPRRLRRERKV